MHGNSAQIHAKMTSSLHIPCEPFQTLTVTYHPRTKQHELQYLLLS